MLAADLYDFHAAGYWELLGYDTFDEWLAGPDIALGRRWVYSLIETWRELVVLRRVDPERMALLEPSKLQEVLPALRRGQAPVDEVLADAEVLSLKDLRDRYRAPSGPDTGTGYNAEAEPAWATCKECGSSYRVAS